MGKFAYKEMLQVKGYPSSLKLIKHSKSRFYWVHFSTYIPSKGTIKIRKSTKTEVQNEAIKFAKDFYEDLIIKKRMGDFPADNTFGRYATKLIKLLEKKVEQETYSSIQLNNDNSKLTNDLLPYFADTEISEINHLTIQNFLQVLSDKGLVISSQKKHLTLIRKILNIALKDKIIKELPKLN